MMVVVPPATALLDPVSQSSPVGEFFWARWTWLSMPPGVTYAPSASIILVFEETGNGPVARQAIFPFLIPSSRPSGSTSLAVTFSWSATFNHRLQWHLRISHSLRSDQSPCCRSCAKTAKYGRLQDMSLSACMTGHSSCVFQTFTTMSVEETYMPSPQPVLIHRKLLLLRPICYLGIPSLAPIR